MSSKLKRKSTSQPGRSSTKRVKKLVEVVSDGDVTLRVGHGDDCTDIRVSGAVIVLASELFDRMLSSSFIEARTKVIELEEDDPNVVLDFCNIAHHKIENLDHCDGARLLKAGVFG